MKLLTKNEIFNTFLSMKVGNSYWGYKFNYDVFCTYKNFIFFDIKNVFLKIKKIIKVIFNISKLNGICLVFFSELLLDLNILKNEKRVKNFYHIFLNKLFGFLTNLHFFLNKKLISTTKKYTNYRSLRLPSIVFITRNCLKNFDKFFMLFVKLRIIVIRSNQFIFYSLKNVGYDISINNCLNFYNVLNLIYKIVFVIKKIW